jgi:hypothetical protein
MYMANALNTSDDHTNSMSVHHIMDTHLTTYLNDEHIQRTTSMTSSHLEGVPHAYIVTTLIFSTATYGLTLLASKQLRWSTNLHMNASTRGSQKA